MLKTIKQTNGYEVLVNPQYITAVSASFDSDTRGKIYPCLKIHMTDGKVWLVPDQKLSQLKEYLYDSN